ncbi:MAG: hypothetical protein L3J00_01700 [Thiomicrorhabdus sp.]|nr:hypothetical protein [Thiomicrorhabdus sp.]
MTMTKYKIIIPFVLGLFVWQGVADAASISTRVRVLEGKVAKQDRAIKSSLKSLQSRESKVEKSLAKVNALEKKVDGLLNKKGKNHRLERADKRYAFP